MSPFFFQKYWHIVGDDVTKTVLVTHPSEGGFMGPMKSSPQLWKGDGVIVGWRLWWLVCISSPCL